MVLSLSIEKDAQVAPFFIHDSPREADLDIEVYYRHFRYIRWMEEQFDRPPFQYIVTTTTPPPADLAYEPWLRQTLRGSPGSERVAWLRLVSRPGRPEERCIKRYMLRECPDWFGFRLFEY